MNEMPLPLALQLGLNRINARGAVFKPNMASLLMDFQASPGLSGVAALPAERGQAAQGYELVKWSAAGRPTPNATLDDLWTCALEHYGLTATATALGIGGIPISKLRLGYYVQPGSSKYTNLVSHYGFKFFPMATLPHGSAAARLAKTTLGTIRIFGIVGRAVPFIAIGLAIYDVVSIGMCAYEERNRK